MKENEEVVLKLKDAKKVFDAIVATRTLLARAMGGKVLEFLRVADREDAEFILDVIDELFDWFYAVGDGSDDLTRAHELFLKHRASSNEEARADLMRHLLMDLDWTVREIKDLTKKRLLTTEDAFNVRAAIEVLQGALSKKKKP